MALTARQATFVREYLAHFNGTRAAITAGYSEKTARAIASENLKKPVIRAEIARCQTDLRKRLEPMADAILKGLAGIAFANVGEVFGRDGALLPIEEWPREFGLGLRELRVTTTGGRLTTRRTVTTIKMQNKVKALEVLAMRFGMIPPKILKRKQK